jgi:hypothetical protein
MIDRDCFYTKKISYAHLATKFYDGNGGRNVLHKSFEHKKM